MSERRRKPARTKRDTQLYFMFISIVFGVFIAVWIEPVTIIFPYSGVDATNPNFDVFIERLWSVKMFIGITMFMMLVCLWWWYGSFLGYLSPAKGFWLYFYDFITLCSFAIGFRLWYHPIVFPMIVVIAATLMLIRFAGVLAVVDEVKSNTRGRAALRLAINVLLTFVLVSIGMVMQPIFQNSGTSYQERLANNWEIYQFMVIGLLFVGIIATVLAVLITEGPPFKFPREPEEWSAEPWRWWPKNGEASSPTPDRETQ